MRNCTLHVSLRHRLGPLDLDVQFTIDSPWTALFAPSGAGKTTILRMIAGLDRPDAGRIVFKSPVNQEFVMLDTATNVFVPPHRRRVRMVTQRSTLFPNRSVAQNVAYGGFFPVRDKQEQMEHRDCLEDILKRWRIDHIRDKMPSQLSGGEIKRVAIAQAVSAHYAYPGSCRPLLLDEPFTGLQTELRDEIIGQLRAWSMEEKTRILLVTHDVGEVFAVDAQVLKMESGRIVAQGPAAEVLAEERDRLIKRLQAP